MKIGTGTVIITSAIFLVHFVESRPSGPAGNNNNNNQQPNNANHQPRGSAYHQMENLASTVAPIKLYELDPNSGARTRVHIFLRDPTGGLSHANYRLTPLLNRLPQAQAPVRPDGLQNRPQSPPRNP